MEHDSLVSFAKFQEFQLKISHIRKTRLYWLTPITNPKRFSATLEGSYLAPRLAAEIHRLKYDLVVLYVSHALTDQCLESLVRNNKTPLLKKYGKNYFCTTRLIFMVLRLVFLTYYLKHGRTWSKMDEYGRTYSRLQSSSLPFLSIAYFMTKLN